MEQKVLEILKNCTIDGNNVKLPNGQLDKKLYQGVAKKLNLIGGKWKGGKTAAFVFPSDPTELLNQVANGEARNIKKEYQFYATPSILADDLVEYADISETDDILEPSAGQGAIIQAINRILPNKIVDCYELMDINRDFLSKITTANLIGNDFLAETNLKFYDKIIANPPFSNNQDISHVREMYNRLKIGGRLVSITSKHWNLSNNKKEKDFKNWLNELNAEVYDIENGAFKSSGTMIGGYIIVINKR